MKGNLKRILQKLFLNFFRYFILLFIFEIAFLKSTINHVFLKNKLFHSFEPIRTLCNGNFFITELWRLDFIMGKNRNLTEILLLIFFSHS